MQGYLAAYPTELFQIVQKTYSLHLLTNQKQKRQSICYAMSLTAKTVTYVFFFFKVWSVCVCKANHVNV